MTSSLGNRWKSAMDVSTLPSNRSEENNSDCFKKPIATPRRLQAKNKNDPTRRSNVDIRAEQFEKGLISNGAASDTIGAKSTPRRAQSFSLTRSPMTSNVVKSAIALWEKKQKVMLGFSPGKRFFNLDKGKAIEAPLPRAVDANVDDDDNDENDKNTNNNNNNNNNKNNNNSNSSEELIKNNQNSSKSDKVMSETLRGVVLRRKNNLANNPFVSTPERSTFKRHSIQGFPSFQIKTVREERSEDEEDAYSTCSETSEFWDGGLDDDDDDDRCPLPPSSRRLNRSHSTKSHLIGSNVTSRKDKDPLGKNEAEPANVTTPPSTNKPKRTFKNFLASLIGWKSNGSHNNNSQGKLPKGSRDYYSARESLGEEMRDFRENTMPKLMERAGRKIDEKNEGLPFIDEQKEFAELISQPRIREEKMEEDEDKPVCHATIRSIYGQPNNRRSMRIIEEQSKRLEDYLDSTYEPVYPSRNISENPTGAPVVRSRSPTTEHLVRPSKVRDLQKRLSVTGDLHYSTISEIQDEPEQVSAFTSDDVVVYDVPRPFSSVVKFETPKYENINIIEDDRLNRSKLTTF